MSLIVKSVKFKKYHVNLTYEFRNLKNQQNNKK